jgi:diaminohydroxyphosphoribosylaminopyrimidine deaminase/5-amino-6-(5-phosphoribosylamino)uracil reductase
VAGIEFSRDDRQRMRRALTLARRGWGRTSPNPMVGCVIVRRGETVGEGWHRAAGGPHAEVEALRVAGKNASGSTVYVTLEPCSHHGRTPPCADALIAAGVNRVVAAVQDPNPEVAGRGFRRLRRAGIEVDSGLLEEDAAALNEAFFRHVTSGLPFLQLKAAMTLDGKTGAAGGVSKWISCEASRRLVHRWRLGADAVMVGSGTALADDPDLTPRPPAGGRQWDWKRVLRVVLDSRLRLPPTAGMLGNPERGAVLVYTSRRAPKRREDALVAAGAEVVRIAASRRGGLDLHRVLEDLGRRGTVRVLLEGGATVNAAALDAGLVDRLSLFLAPKLLGGTMSVPLLNGLPGDDLGKAVQLHRLSCRRVGRDLLVEAAPRRD